MDIKTAKSQFSAHVKNLQDQITQQMLSLDPKLQLTEDKWRRQDFKNNDGGGGITRAFEGDLFENAGVNTSEVYGEIDPQFAAKLKGNASSLWATGISLIIHPRNPKVPTVHANFRMIHQGDEHWFGGGVDLTPYYPYEEDFKYFHGVLKQACEPYGCYDWMKKECDQYFVNHHRDGEMRGIGGIFYDHINSGDLASDLAQFIDISKSFIESYFPIVEKRMNEKWDEADEEFQLYRRGRYVEFNLLHDRGTLFGLKTKGRTKSILISLPARTNFSYTYQPRSGSPQEKMNEYYWPHPW